MFREMRRKKQALPLDEIEAILYRGTSGVLALSGDNDYPYALPISYVYDGHKLFFHCAKSRHKIDAIQRNCKPFKNHHAERLKLVSERCE